MMSGDAPREAHALSFRVARLSKPSLALETGVKLDLTVDMGEAVAIPVEKMGQMVPVRAFEGRTQSEEAAATFGVDGSLCLANSRQAIYLGETFSCYVSLANNSDQVVSAVGIKAELQSERSRVVLFDNTATPTPAMAPGVRKNFIVHHDVKELGVHTMICSSSFTTQEAERRYVPQYFRFTALSPLSLRTKVRSAADNLFLEACVENSMKSPLVLDYIRFDPTTGYTVEEIQAERSQASSGPLKDYINSLTIIPPEHGTRNFLFKFTPIDSDAMSLASSGVLGKMEIKWRGPLGDSGRLQTQQISAGPNVVQRQQVDIKILALPERIIQCQPFQATVRVRSNLRDVDLRQPCLVLRPGGDKPKYVKDVIRAPSVVLEGAQAIPLDPLRQGKDREVQVALLALHCGVQLIDGLMVVDAADDTIHGKVEATSVFVELPEVD